MEKEIKKVMVFGTFDIFHPGHINFFNQAKKHGDILIIVVARDMTVERVKGEKPLYDEVTRKRKLEHFDRSNKIVLGSQDDPYEIIKKYKPDVICLGYDQESFTDKLEEKLIELDVKAKVIRLEPFKEGIYKSSILKEKLKFN
ncbi:MAG: adenylyltransferase/cytidyltransferase family protein [Candidatus Woesearchaeota archaeon]